MPTGFPSGRYSVRRKAKGRDRTSCTSWTNTASSSFPRTTSPFRTGSRAV